MQALTGKTFPFEQHPFTLNPAQPFICERKAYQKQS